jgi:diguanylate cyclase (GGDEF)-like protein
VVDREGGFDPDDIVIDFNDAPYLLVNFENNLYRFSIDLSIKTYTPYELKITSGECRTIVGGSAFIDLEKNKPLSLKPAARGQYRLEKSLTDGEVRRALQLFGDATEKRVHVEFHFSIISPFGEHEINPAAKVTCITMCRVGWPEADKQTMQSFTKQDVKIAILKELAEAGKPQNKFNLLGGRNPGAQGPLEHRLHITFDSSDRALAAQAFEELKRDGPIQSTYTDLADPENWVEITAAGVQALKTGEFKEAPATHLGKFGIPDHTAFQNRLSEMGGSYDLISALFLDLDNFKQVNDTYDHSTGDQVIREAITIVQNAIKGKGEIFHRSGDEMLVLLPNFDHDEAYTVAERVRRNIGEFSFSVVEQGLITATIGLSNYPSICSQLGELEVTADRAAMEAKKRGRNIVLSTTSLNRPATGAAPRRPRLSQTESALLLALREELVINVKLVTGVVYDQLDRLCDDQYRRVSAEAFYIMEVPENVRSVVSAAYRAVRNVNGSIERVREVFTSDGVQQRNDVLKSKQQCSEPLRAALDALRRYLAESGIK